MWNDSLLAIGANFETHDICRLPYTSFYLGSDAAEAQECDVPHRRMPY